MAVKGLAPRRGGATGKKPVDAKKKRGAKVVMPELQVGNGKCIVPKPSGSSRFFFETLEGRQVQTSVEMVPLENITQWAHNCRRPFDYIGDTSLSEEKACWLMLQLPEVRELAYGILANGGTPKALLGVPESSDLSSMTVADGNCRAAIIKLGNGLITIPDDHALVSFRDEFMTAVQKYCEKEGKQKPFPDKVPVKIYWDSDPMVVASSVGYEHSAQANAWTAQGRGVWAYHALRQHIEEMPQEFTTRAHLRKLWKILNKEEHLEAIKKVGLAIKQNRSHIVRETIMAVVATLLFEKRYPNFGSHQGRKARQPKDSRFNYFRKFYSEKAFRDLAEGNAEGRRRISDRNHVRFGEEYVIDHFPEIEDRFMEWLAQGKITDSVHVPALVPVLDDAEARAEFENGGDIHSALDLIDQKLRPQMLGELVKDINVMTQSLETIFVDSDLLANFKAHPNAKARLADLVRVARRLEIHSNK